LLLLLRWLQVAGWVVFVMDHHPCGRPQTSITFNEISLFRNRSCHLATSVASLPWQLFCNLVAGKANQLLWQTLERKMQNVNKIKSPAMVGVAFTTKTS